MRGDSNHCLSVNVDDIKHVQYDVCFSFFLSLLAFYSARIIKYVLILVAKLPTFFQIF